jgi:poly(A) polymerase
VAKELLTLLDADDPRRAVAAMAEVGILAEVLPEAGARRRFEALVGIESTMLFNQDALLRLAALLPDEPAAGVGLARRLRLSNAGRVRLEAALKPSPKIVSWMSPRQVRQEVYRLGVQAFCDRVMLSWAASDRPAATPQWRALLPMAKSWPRPTLPLSGEEVVAAGVPRGPLVGEVLREVEAWWVDNDFVTDKLSIIEVLKAVAQGIAF